MKFFHGFKEFAVRGNVVDMGIGVIIGSAFSRIVESFVSDIIMPPLGIILGKVDFTNLYINLSGGDYRSLAQAKEAGAATINYGVFMGTIIHFAIVAFATYFTILQINRIRKVPFSMSQKKCPYCLSDIPQHAVKCPNCTTILDERLLHRERKKMKVNMKAG